MIDHNGKLLLDVIHTLATSDAVRDTIWMPGYGAVHTTATDVLSEIAIDHGATDAQVAQAGAGQPVTLSENASLEGRENCDSRFAWAMRRLCGACPPLDIVNAWFDASSADTRLQDWVAKHVPAGVMAIEVIEAADSIAQGFED